MASASSERIKEVFRVCRVQLEGKKRDDYLAAVLGLIFLHYCAWQLKSVNLAPIYAVKDDPEVLDLLDSFARSVELELKFGIRSIFPISYVKLGEDIDFFQMVSQLLDALSVVKRDDFLPVTELVDYAIDVSGIKEVRGKEPSTPESVASLIAELMSVDPVSPETVYDPCSGYGVMLRHIAQRLGCRVSGQEIDEITRAISIIQLTIHDVDAHGIMCGDSFSAPQNVRDGKLETYDAVVVNPAFWGRDWNMNMTADGDGRHMTPEMDPWHRFDYGVPSPTKCDYAFLMHSSACTKKDCIDYMVVPNGALFRTASEAKIRKIMLESGHLLTVIGLPARLFDVTGAPACVIIFKKGEPLSKIIAEHKEELVGDVYFIDATNLGHVCPSKRTRRYLSEEDISKIVKAYAERKDIPLFARNVSLQEIRDNDYNLNISRYIMNVDDASMFDANHLEQGISNLEERLKVVQSEMQRLRDEL